MSKIPYLTRYNEDGSIAERGELWSPITGCSGKGCKAHCWAREYVKFRPIIHDRAEPEYILGVGMVNEPAPFSQVIFHPDRLNKPLHWRKPRRIGVCFTGDLFDEQVRGSWLYSIYPVMVEADWHTYFVLTKQVKRMAQRISDTKNAWKNRTSHIWHGGSICDQEDWNRMASIFLQIPGKKWISIEPMLALIHFLQCELIDISLIVIGCESGPKRRPCPIENMVSVVEQCKAASVPCYVKQIDLNGKVCHDINLFPKELQVRELP